MLALMCQKTITVNIKVQKNYSSWT